MWLERFVIIVISLHRDFLPSSWGMFCPTVWDWGLYIGTIGFFLLLMFLFIRLLPMISVFELRELVSRKRDEKGAAGTGRVGAGEHGRRTSSRARARALATRGDAHESETE